MGITGLLPFLENATRPCNVAEFRGGTVAVDSYCWLHKGASSCADQLAKGQDKQVYVHYCLKYINMLLSYDIRPIMVFDGRNLPAKACTEIKRREQRNKARLRATELLRLGKADEAKNYFRQCVDITPVMALNLIRECRKINVDCIVAPYESDAQLAFFSLKGIADCIITEDSDLLLFGCKKVLYKMDMNGNGLLVDADKINLCMKMRPDQFNFEKFRHMCILSGCDYLPSLQGIGLKKACKFITLTAEQNPQIFLNRLPRYLNMYQLDVTEEYIENFMKADATFRHQIVFDPFKKKLVPLTDPAISGTNPDHCKNAGEVIDDENAYHLALGNLHPNTLEKLDDWKPPFSSGQSNSIWSQSYKKPVSRKEQKAQVKLTLMKKQEVELEIDDEVVKMQEDIKLETELAFYKIKDENKSISSVETLTKKETPEKPEAEKISPVLSKNPFIKRKNISKFQITTTVENKSVVKSRFFCSKLESPDDIKNESIEVPKNDSPIDNMNMEYSNVEYPCSNNLDYGENMATQDLYIASTPSQESDIENCPVNSNSSSEDFCRTKIRKRSETDEEESVKFESQLDFIDLTQSSNEGTSDMKKNEVLKRRKLGQCRSVGLSKQPLKNQQTIQNFFSKIKKN